MTTELEEIGLRIKGLRESRSVPREEIAEGLVLAKGWSGSDELATELQERVRQTTAPCKHPHMSSSWTSCRR